MTAIEERRATTTGVAVRGLRVETAGGAPIVEDLSLDAPAGRIVGLVGESGSGKTAAGLALLGMVRRGTRIASGSVMLGGIDVLSLPRNELRGWRGTVLSYVPQQAEAALNPATPVGRQLCEATRAGGVDGYDCDARVERLLREVGLPSDAAFQRRRPHELSPGELRRMSIAMAFAPHPALVVLDDPTSGLDATTRGHLLDTVRELAEHSGCAALVLGRDLAVVADVSEDIAVMYAGTIVEKAATDDLARDPRHPYTARLVAAVPDLAARRELRGIPGAAPHGTSRPGGCRFEPRCPLATPDCVLRLPELDLVGARHWARCMHSAQVKPVATVRPLAPRHLEELPPLLRVEDLTARYGREGVLDSVDLEVGVGASTALLGDPDSGTTALARVIAGLHSAVAGAMWFRGLPLRFGAANRTVDLRKCVSYVFPDPDASLDPRRTVAESVVRPLRVLSRVSRRQSGEVARSVLQLVELPPGVAGRYPAQLSAGERQRVAIARGLVTAPDLLVCDEITGRLDMPVQAEIVELLRRLSSRMGFAMLFVTQDIALAGSVASRVAVLRDGRVVEQGPTEEVLTAPAHPYTRELLETAPAFALA
ncbi:MAG: ABC transporter ATP-binding protein [Streptosporangiales bacterium]